MILNIKYSEKDYDGKVNYDLEKEQSIIEDISELRLSLEDKMIFIWEIYKHLYNQYRYIYKDDKDLMLKLFENELWPEK